mmetsp:Transcript_4374/g.3988  ORF Transcript_4374/g.3988 Transcript_4374/m.3988 type:complete len:90 (-) Transcript_4374:56-325(-)
MGDITSIEYLMGSEAVQEVGNGDRETCVAKLEELDFTKELQRKKVSELSGGWKMKLSLAEAMLRKQGRTHSYTSPHPPLPRPQQEPCSS